ncbi:(2Fe-2S)-binding protein [Paenibacillus sp. GSMTC-2017]|uniref:(2Fe-2S)-binding protein n=1 Tax=Paenibacillus sp. GSMTC-2017 TaxID=2794350 RepID=UPI0018D6539F|nr:(2Fe-2S)-binding protein [Paenibacillus sp. GSMTC-2017]MBH5317711.1 (2Fe-2S)-binding protein [Paenibacillus sp. GSMTC-2017]
MSNEVDFTLIKTYFHTSPEGADAPCFELHAPLLLVKERALEALNEAVKLSNASGLELPASFTGMTFFNLGFMNLIFGALYNRMLRLPLKAMTLQLEAHDDHAHLGYKLNELDWLIVPEEQTSREAMLQAAWIEYIRETAIPAINGIADAADLRPDMIWNQFGSAIHSSREYLRAAVPIPGLADKIDADFLIVEALPAEVFNRRRNPFVHKPRYLPDPWSAPDGTCIMKSSCCMYDQRDDGIKCYTCPKLLPAEREERRVKVLAEIS